MNDHDSDRIMRQMGGYKTVTSEKEADVVILNTCSIRDKAEAKVLSRIGRLKELKKNRDVVVAVGGCMAQRLGKELLDRYSHVDVVFGTHVIPSASYLIERAFEGERVLDISEKGVDQFSFAGLGEERGKENVSANVTIMNGCDNYCSYCIVPYVRGPEVSRKPIDIVSEVEHLVSKGVKEITLLGQNVNSYGNKASFDVSFSELLRKVDAVSGLERLRFVTSHPKDLSDELIGLFGELGSLCEHIHLPLQSGSDKILGLMNRKYTASEYMALIEKLRAKCPSIAITTDIIVAYPGEDESDFRDTMAILKDVRYDGAFSFKYSQRPGTEASSLDMVEEGVAQERLDELQKLQIDITYEKNREIVGTEVEVLVEGAAKRSGQCFGRSRGNKIVNFKGNSDYTGKLLNISIKEAKKNSVYGEML